MTSYSEYIIITGGSSGIGLEAAKAAAHDNPTALIVITGRTEPTVDLPANVKFQRCDLGDISAVREFASSWPHPPVSALICNAGAAMNSISYNAEGYEHTFSVNHLGHAALFHALEEGGHLAPDARIILTSSSLHKERAPESRSRASYAEWTSADGAAHGKTPEGTEVAPGTAYANTKLANVLWAYALARRENKYSVMVLSPGFVPGSNLFRDQPPVLRTVAGFILPRITWVLDAMGMVTSTTPRSGAALAALLKPEHVGEKGTYYTIETKGESSPQSHKEQLQEELWSWTIKALGVRDPYIK